MNHGYKFKVLSAYTFDSALIFEEYIKDLYEIKANSSKDDPMYLIAKLLMNSLYGRWGMDWMLESHQVINSKDIFKYMEKYNLST